MINNRYILICVGAPVVGILISLLYYYSTKDDKDKEDKGKGRGSTGCHKVQLKIPKTRIAAVIGRGGAVLKDIENKTNARVVVDRDTEEDSETVLCTVIGVEQNVRYAEVLIQKIISDVNVEETHELLIPVQMIGHIIGRNGRIIKQIQHTSGAHVSVLGDKSNQVTRKCPVKIKGTKRQVLYAMAFIDSIITKQESQKWDLEDGVGSNNENEASTSELSKENTYDRNEMELCNSRNEWHRMIDELSKRMVKKYLYCDHTPISDTVVAYISHIVSVDRFYIQLPHTTEYKAFKRMIIEMSNLYCSEESQKYTVNSNLKVNSMVAAPYVDTVWYRAKVTEIIPSENKNFSETKLELLYVDFGYVATKKVDRVRYLKSEFLTTPFQAVPCVLKCLVPLEGDWTEGDIEMFESLTGVSNDKEVKLLIEGIQDNGDGSIIVSGMQMMQTDLQDDEPKDVLQEMVKLKRGIITNETERAFES